MWRRYLRFIRPPIARDVDEELRFHFQSRIEELIAGGEACQHFDVRAIGARVSDHHVRGLQIAVQDALRVRGRQRREYLQH